MAFERRRWDETVERVSETQEGGSWRCDACPAGISWREYEGGRDASPVAPPGDTLARVVARAPLFSSSEGYKCASPVEAVRKRKEWGAWLAEAEMYTSLFRQRRAARHRLKSASHWHRVREKGQAERFDRIAQCGAVRWVLRRHTADGTTETPIESRCDCWRLCSKCLERRKYRLTTGIEAQREKAFSQHALQQARWYRGSEGRWSERLITLTVTHSESPAADARMLTRGWRELSARIARHLKLDRGCTLAPVWVRALEVEPGGTGGHAHLHVWWFGPFLDHAWLRVQWGRIIQKMGAKVPQKPWAEALAGSVDKRFADWGKTRRGQNGRAPAAVPWPVVDITGARSGDGAIGRYAQKVGVNLHRYVGKGAKTVLQRVHPAHAASVYEALESARCVQWARGWAPKREKPDGVTYSRRPLTPEEERAVHERCADADRELVRSWEVAEEVKHEEAPPMVESRPVPPVARLRQMLLRV